MVRLGTGVILGEGLLGSGNDGAALDERRTGDLRCRQIDAERVGVGRGQAGQRRLVGLADHDGHDLLEPLQEGRTTSP